MKVVVIGGGFVGQLVQLAVPDAVVLDWRKEAPADHLETRQGPQYLWAPIPGVQNEEFDVLTTVDGLAPTPESILAYKQKIGKEEDGGDWGLQFQSHMKGWDAKLPKPTIQYNAQVRMIDLLGHSLGMADWSTIEYDLLVSTIPMPAFLGMLILGPEWNGEFKSDPIFMCKANYVGESEPRGMHLNYNSSADDSIYRTTTVTSGAAKVLFHESLTPIPGSRKIMPGKIHPHPDNEIILSHLAVQQCFCFGRFATWRPDELAHQTWQEIELWKGQMGL